MERSRILGAGVWTGVGLVAAFAVVGATSNRHCATATKANATVAQAPACCAQDVKAAPAVAAVAPKALKTKSVARPAVRISTGVNGVVVALDPESGELGMPSSSQMAELEAAQQLLPSDELSHSDAGLTPVTRPDGSVYVNLQGRFQEFATVHIAPNGKRIMGCSDRATLDVPVTPAAPSALEEK